MIDSKIAKLWDQVKSCSTCFYNLRVCPSECDSKYSAWKCANLKEVVMKSCDNCVNVSDDKMDCKYYQECYNYDKWELKESIKFVKNNCDNCGRSNVLPKSGWCNGCKDNRYINWIEDSLIVTNYKGAKQSKIDTAFSLVPHDSLLAVAKVMKIGSERYEKDNWRKLSADEIYDHLMEHLVNWHMTGNMEDLEHGMTRAMMLYSVVNDGQ